MFKAFVLIALFSALPVFAQDNDRCFLTFTIEQDKLTFFKQDENDKSYFYAKVMTTENEISKINIKALSQLDDVSGDLMNTQPYQYQLPDNAKKIYLVKAKEKPPSFKGVKHVIPKNSSDKAIDPNAIKKRNASNHIQTLPKETRKPNVIVKDGDVTICEFGL